MATRIHATAPASPPAEPDGAGFRFRAVSWNLFNGGIDSGLNQDVEQRFDDQIGILARLHPDILALQECTRWDKDGRADTVAAELGLSITEMACSRVGNGRNHTMLLHNPRRFALLDAQLRGTQVFHHALIRAHLRPHDAPSDGSADLNVLATHLSWTDGATRLAEARWMTDYAGPFPGTPDHGLLMGDLNTPHPDDVIDWDDVPNNLQSRYRLVRDDGTFGDADTRAYGVLLAAGWQDPETLTRRPRTGTVGHYYANEPTPMRLDHALVHHLTAHTYRTHDTPQTRTASDHLPVVLDAEIPAP
ncbi:endonuclease/exonuclease/phosphatase family protein [Streptomyces sp. NPDC004539]|uniref:endonuclease/exonuclease/phosphatase family protein n=1 Tax=Streptomyces sp. NPDC004539 TaxID=3154280 RepID=UPI0033AC34AE